MYSTVEDKFWTDPYLHRAHEDIRSLMLYYLTTPNRNILGLYHLPEPLAAYHLGWKAERYQKARNELIRAGRIFVDDDADLIFIVNFLKFNPVAGPGQITFAVSTIKDIPLTPLFKNLRDAFEKVYRESYKPIIDTLDTLTAQCQVTPESHPVSHPTPTQDTPDVPLEPAATPTQHPTPVTVTITSTHNNNNNSTSISPLPPVPPPPKVEKKKKLPPIYQECIDQYNKLLPDLSEAIVMSPTTQGNYNARLKVHTPEFIFAVFKSINDMPWLMGENDTGWKANLDWILLPTNWAKIINGTYKKNNKVYVKPDAYNQKMNFLFNEIKKDYDKEGAKKENEPFGDETSAGNYIDVRRESKIPDR